MTARVTTLAPPIQQLVTEVTEVIEAGATELETLYAPRSGGLGFVVERARVRLAWAVVAQWLVGYLNGQIGPRDSLRDAEEWFLAGAPGDLPRFAPNRRIPSSDDIEADELRALLPYVLDPLAAGTRLTALRSERHRLDRAMRKASGIFYTPADLAQYMVRELVDTSTPTGAWLDPACGSGVFMRLAALEAQTWSVFGVDIDPLAAEAAAFVMADAVMSQSHDKEAYPWSLWHLARLNIATADALLIEPGVGPEDDPDSNLATRTVIRDALQEGEWLAPGPGGAMSHLGSIFPDLVDGPASIVMNPPYASLGRRSDFRILATHLATVDAAPKPETLNTYLPFVEQGMRLSNGVTGSFCAVTPLSIATSNMSSVRALRTLIDQTPGEWTFRFFDRAPDALFGDDVKTRNAVVSLRRDRVHQVRTTALIKWTSSARAVALGGGSVSQGAISISDSLPKVGTEADLKLYRALRRPGLGHLASVIKTSRATEMSEDWPPMSIGVSSVAYNWLNIVANQDAARTLGHSSTTRFHVITVPELLFWPTYSVLSSLTAFWLWRTEGDGFHVTRRFLSDLPFALGRWPDRLLSQLTECGRALWEVASSSPQVSLNAGKITIAFPSVGDQDGIAAIDRLIVMGTASPPTTRLRIWHTHLVDVGRAAKEDIKWSCT
jgi:predicted RNA methylase